MVFLQFADGSSNNIPLEELQKLPFFKKLPSLTDDSQELNLSTINKDLTYNNLIVCIALSTGQIEDSYYELADFLGIDLDYNKINIDSLSNIHKFNLDDAIKNKDYESIIVRSIFQYDFITLNYFKLRDLPFNIIKNCINDNNKNILLKCVSYHGGDKKIVKYLLNTGANVNYNCKRSNDTPLIFASEKGHKEIVELLVKNGANLNDRGFYQETALTMASFYGHTEIVEILIKAGADHNIYNSNPALINASINDYIEIVKLLIKAGVNINIINKLKDTALICASKKGHIEIVKFLINAGANVNLTNHVRNTALIYASNHGHVEIVNLLLTAGADPTVKNASNETALSLALLGKHIPIIKMIREVKYNSKTEINLI